MKIAVDRYRCDKHGDIGEVYLMIKATFPQDTQKAPLMRLYCVQCFVDHLDSVLNPAVLQEPGGVAD